MANSINPYNGKDAIDQLRTKFKNLQNKGAESANADAEGEGAEAAAAAAEKTPAQQIKDVFERSGLKDLFNRGGKSSTYGPGGTLKNAAASKDATSLLPEASSFDNLLKKLGIDPSWFGKSDSSPTAGTEAADPVASSTDAAKANASQSYQYARVQYELNVSVMQTMNNGSETVTQAMNFSLKFDYEWMSASTGASSNSKASNPLGISSGDDANSIMKKLQDYFSPEKTAGRILDFAKGFYPNSKWAKDGDTAESRQGFSDYIGAAIQKGFDQAMGVLGKVDQKTQDGIDKTHQIVFDGLKDFVKNGMDANEAQRASNTEAWRMSLEMNYTSIYMRQSNNESTLARAANEAQSQVAPATATADTDA